MNNINVNIKKYINIKGINFFGLLTIVFITLKLLDKITWSWLWVLSPLWIPTCIILIIFFIIIFSAVILSIIKSFF